MYRSHLDEIVRQHYPQPIAHAWARYCGARTDLDRIRCAKALQETVARTLGAYLLAERVATVGGHPGKAVDQALGQVPSSGARWTLVDVLCRDLPNRPTGFFAPAKHWYRGQDDKPTEAFKSVSTLVNLRNLDVHDIPTGDPAELASSACEMDRAMVTLLGSMTWIAEYRIVRLGPASVRSGRGPDGVSRRMDVGAAQVFVGEAEVARSMEWELPRTAGGIDTDWVLLAHGQRGLLCLEPFVVIKAEAHRERLFLWKTTGRHGHVIAAQELSTTEFDTRTVPMPSVMELLEGPADPSRYVPHSLQGALGTPVVLPAAPHLPPGYVTRRSAIGRGGMAIVDMVSDTTDTTWAMKYTDPEVQDGTCIARLEREGHILERLAHPNVVPGRLMHARNNRPVLRMPYLNAGTLAERMRKPLSIDMVRSWVEGLLEGLAYLSKQKVVHRDIKPQNLMVSGQETLVIMDFGVAWTPESAADPLTYAGQQVGTPGYMAPEQQSGRYSPSNDVYAAGVVALQLLAALYGRKEWENTDVERLLRTVQTVASTPQSRQVLDLARLMVEAEPLRRLSAADALQRLRHVPNADTSRTATDHDGRPHGEAAAARALGESVRSAISTASATNILQAVQSAAGESASSGPCLAAQELHRYHTSRAWYMKMNRASVGELVETRALRLDVSRVLTAAAETFPGATAHDVRMMSAGTLGLRVWTEAHRVATPVALDESRFRAHLARRARKGRDDEAEAAATWGGFAQAVRRTYRVEHRARSGGGLRRLDVPEGDLAVVQRCVGRALLHRIPAHPAATAFVPGRSTALHAVAHAGARVAVVNDLRDFFGHIRPAHIDWLLPAPRMDKRVPQPSAGPHPSPFDGWTREGTDAMRRVLFRYEPVRRTWYLPQGAPSSPIVSNLAALALDQAIEHELRRALPDQPWRYTRYADDLVVSSTWPRRDFASIAQRVVEDCVSRFGWSLAREKRRVWASSSERPLVLCGVSVPARAGQAPSLPRTERRRVRAAAQRLTTDAPVHSGDANARGIVAYAFSVTGDLRLAPLISESCRLAVRELAQALAPEDVDGFLDGWLRGAASPDAPWREFVSSDGLPF